MSDDTIKTTFTIDLLKGQGLPLRSSPAGIAVTVISAALPVLMAIVTAGLYMHNKGAISKKEKEITELTVKIDGMSETVELQKALEQEKNHYGVCLAEVQSSIERFNPWSPVLTTLVENMPESVILTELRVEQEIVKKKVPDKENPKKMNDIDTFVTTMRVTVSDSSRSNSDEAVKEFRDFLCSSPLLGPRLEKVGVSKESGTHAGQDVVYYLIDCVFKAGL
jgi:Tfp pilus assembly protein PilN